MNKRYNITDPATLANLEDYYEMMLENGFAPLTAKAYMSSAAKYVEDNLPLDRDLAIAYFRSLTTAPGVTKSQRSHIYARKAGVMRYIDYLEGEDLTPVASKSSRTSRKSCNKDCFNCIYPDCIYA